MLERAIEKLKREMAQDKDNAYTQVVGGYLIKFLNKNQEAAERFLVEDKTIGKSLERMRSEASKKKKNNFAMFTFEEGLKIVFEYFGINGKPEVEMPEPQTEHIEKAEISKKDKKIDFDIKLEDFLS